ncbi:hypothetical protein AB0I54_31855 [Streptomyces sp. NPDC050625]|uniref:hypothetical protein n=1 Tax=Streptomyces sp. NPDC050625 TaxID=3154629 RepID=UPI003447CCBF
MSDLTYIERAQFLATVQGMGEGDEIPQAAFELVREAESETAAPWAQSDPLAAERYLAARGATPKAATANAAEFELSMRALYALAKGTRAQSFQDLADWIETNVDGVQ